MRAMKVSLLALENERTREPSPSMTSAPKATNNASIFRHSRLPGAGCEKIAAMVFRCLLFMANDTTSQYHRQATRIDVAPRLLHISGKPSANVGVRSAHHQPTRFASPRPRQSRQSSHPSQNRPPRSSPFSIPTIYVKYSPSPHDHQRSQINEPQHPFPAR